MQVFSTMKKFLLWVVLFFITVAIVDYGFGRAMESLERKSESSNYHCLYKASEDVLILGSSFAVRNIVPQVIEDSLGLTCYNAGEPGVGIVCAWARLNMFLRNHTPRLVVYTLTPGSDYLEAEDYSRYLGKVKYYYGIDESVNQLYADFARPTERIKLRSNLFKYNSGWLTILSNNVSARKDFKGYRPLYEEMDTKASNNEKTPEVAIDSLKLSYLDRTFALLREKKVPVICLLTPQYGLEFDAEQYKAGMELCRRYNIPVYNDFMDKDITADPTLFYDFCHLNDKGAKVYTAKICAYIQEALHAEE